MGSMLCTTDMDLIRSIFCWYSRRCCWDSGRRRRCAALTPNTRRVNNHRGLTGEDAAKIILGPEGLYEVSITGIPGELTDHYDPRSKKLGLSAGVAQKPTVAALAIVAHEIGHALQDHQNYGPLKLRGAIVPAVQLSAWVGPILFFAGLFLRFTGLAWLGVFAFGLTADLRHHDAAGGV